MKSISGNKTFRPGFICTTAQNISPCLLITVTQFGSISICLFRNSLIISLQINLTIYLCLKFFRQTDSNLRIIFRSAQDNTCLLLYTGKSKIIIFLSFAKSKLLRRRTLFDSKSGRYISQHRRTRTGSRATAQLIHDILRNRFR